MNILIKLIKPFIKKAIKRELENKDSRDRLVALVNAKVDLPKLNEQEEAKLLEQLYIVLGENALMIVDRI